MDALSLSHPFTRDVPCCPSADDDADAQFASEESPSGMIARSGTYTVQSRVLDDDKHVWLDVEWGECEREREYASANAGSL